MSIVLYLCDRKACPTCSYPRCKHTADIDHAAHFVRTHGSYVVEQPVSIRVVRATKPKEANNDTHLRRS